MKALDAMPPLRLSIEITAVNAVTSWPRSDNHENNKLLAADNTAPSINVRITPKRIDNTPPKNAPTSVMIRP